MTTCVNRGRYAPPSCFRKFSPPLGYFPPSFFPPAYNRHLDFHSSPSGRSRARKKFIAGVNPRRRLSEQEGAQKVTLSRAHYSIGREQKREEEARERALRDDRSEAARRSPFFQDQFVWIGEVIGGRRRSRTNERTFSGWRLARISFWWHFAEVAPAATESIVRRDDTMARVMFRFLT